MHELSVAMSLVDLAMAESRREGGAVRAVHLRIGDLVGIEQGMLRHAFGLAASGTPVEGSELIIELVPAMVFCRVCNAAAPLQSKQWFGCSVCGEPSAEITQGREFELAALELES
jgi:hydrogenase nickel incorporation protein HypA/HybF